MKDNSTKQQISIQNKMKQLITTQHKHSIIKTSQNETIECILIEMNTTYNSTSQTDVNNMKQKN